MPRIRKKTSRRGSTNQREKIKHKAAETRKKRKRDIKKNPQWKTKHPKDPGIPNNFPYKDQILAEVAEQRRLAVEEKQRRKEAKKAAKAGTLKDDAEGDDSGSEGGFDGISAVAGQKATGSKTLSSVVAGTEEDSEDTPVLINRDLPNLQAVLDIADVVLEVLDSRDPLAYRSAYLEKLVEGKTGQELFFVLNKIDACPREAVQSWSTVLSHEHPTLLFRSASALLPTVDVTGKGKEKERTDDAVGLDSVLTALEKFVDSKKEDKPLIAVVVGLANVGKTSFVNSLIRKATLPIYKLSSAPQDGPTTTTYVQEVALEVGGKQIRLIDTPGISWLPIPEQTPEQVEQSRAKDIMFRNKGRIDKLKDPLPVVTEIVSHANREDLMLFYNIPAFAEGDTNAFLAGVARANSLIKKGGLPDITGASRIILRDWNTGKFPRYTIPSSAPTGTATSTTPTEEDQKILSTLQVRKEMRKTPGLVKLKPAEVDTREINLERSWIGSESDEGSDEEEAEESDEDEGDKLEDDVSDLAKSRDMEGASHEDDEDDEEEEEVVSPPPTGKRKRSAVKATGPPSRPVKKVAFSAEPKNTKQARSAAGAKGSQKVATPKTALKKDIKSADKHKPISTKARTALKPTLKVANSSSKKLQPANGGEEAYDFKKFF